MAFLFWFRVFHAVALFFPFDPGVPTIWFLLLSLLIPTILFLARTAKAYVLPRVSRFKRRRFPGAYHHCVRSTPGFRPRQPKRMTDRRRRQLARRRFFSAYTTPRPTPRSPTVGRRPSKSTRKRLLIEVRNSVLSSLRWREWGFSLPKHTVDSFFDCVNPLSHYHQIRDFVCQSNPSGTDGVMFPHRKALIAALNFNTDTTITYGSFEASSVKPPLSKLSKPGLSEFPIVLDTGASWTVTPNTRDFVGEIQPAEFGELNSLDGKIQVHGIGNVEWLIEDMNGTVRVLRTQALYVPSAGVRLFSPQSYFKENLAGSLLCTHDKCALTLPDGDRLEFPYQPGSKLPLMLTESMLRPDQPKKPSSLVHVLNVSDVSDGEPAVEAQPSVLSPANLNLTGSQKELLLWHQRLGHADLKRVQALLGQPRDEKGRQVLFPINKRVTTCDPPKCDACQYAKQKRRQPASTFSKPRPENLGGLSDMILNPGQRISCDLYESRIRGRLPDTRGKETEDRKYAGGAIFMDVASKFVFLEHIPNLTATFAVKAKHALERTAESYGVSIKEYLTDNHPFKSEEFVRDCENQGQRHTLSGVGAHHQNRVERTVQTTFNWARAMMLHFLLHWPQEADLELWPFAVSYAVWLWNNLPDTSNRVSPLELFMGVSFEDYRHLQRARVFGCPVYVLSAKLQDAKKLPKWSKRAYRGIFLGFSTKHHSTVALVLNPATGYVSPQYHVVFDERFSTVSSTGEEPLPLNQWEKLFDIGYDRFANLDPIEDEDGNLQWDLPPDVDLWPAHKPTVANRETQTFNPTQETGTQFDPVLDPEDPEQREQSSQTDFPVDQRERTVRFADQLRRSTRQRRQPQRLINETYPSQRLGFGGQPQLSKQTKFKIGEQLPRIRGESLNAQRLATLRWDELLQNCRTGNFGALATYTQKETVDGYIEDWHPILLATKANAEDLPTWNEAMNGPHAAGFWKAMEAEIDTLTRKECWEIVERPLDRPVVSGTWAFRIKRYPDGLMRKLKARFCARGYEQTEGVDFFETFAPVVEWSTVRYLLIMSVILGLATAQVDYVAAFIQATIDTEVYVEMPRGFSQPGKVLKLKKSLYGLKQSPRNHYQNIKSKLESLNFKACDSDPCLFVSDKVIALIYVDDTLLFARDANDIQKVIDDLEALGMELQKEDDVAGFLGVHIERRSDGTIKLTQKGLIKRTIEALNIGHLPIKRTPAKLGVLANDPTGDPPNGTFSYPSVLGMMGYLQANSRLDISFAVAQCARFAHKPMRVHEQALERIGQYLKGTMDEGMILNPNKITNKFTTDIYVDADFAGGWGFEDPNDPACVRSRTGYIIEVMGCPVAWKSKLQTDIATSTMEAEYSALSMALRAAIPLLEVVKYVVRGFSPTNEVVTTFKTTVHEDNQGALRLAKMEPGRNTPRSKFYAIKHHWFRSWLKPSEIELQYIESKQQKADILTKSLGTVSFEDNRKLSCGW